MSCRLLIYVRRKVKLLSNSTPKIPSRFCWVGFDIEKLYWKHREVFAQLFLFPMRRNSVLSGFSFSLFINIHDWTEAKHDCKPFSAAAEYTPPPPMQRKHTADYHQHRANLELHLMISFSTTGRCADDCVCPDCTGWQDQTSYRWAGAGTVVHIIHRWASPRPSEIYDRVI